MIHFVCSIQEIPGSARGLESQTFYRKVESTKLGFQEGYLFSGGTPTQTPVMKQLKKQVLDIIYMKSIKVFNFMQMMRNMIPDRNSCL